MSRQGSVDPGSSCAVRVLLRRARRVNVQMDGGGVRDARDAETCCSPTVSVPLMVADRN